MAEQILSLRVTPRSSKDDIVGWSTTEREELLVRVGAAPDNGAANAAVVRLLARSLGLPKSDISIAIGHTSRKKLLRLNVDVSSYVAWKESLPVKQ